MSVFSCLIWIFPIIVFIFRRWVFICLVRWFFPKMLFFDQWPKKDILPLSMTWSLITYQLFSKCYRMRINNDIELKCCWNISLWKMIWVLISYQPYSRWYWMLTARDMGLKYITEEGYFMLKDWESYHLITCIDRFKKPFRMLINTEIRLVDWLLFVSIEIFAVGIKEKKSETQ